MFCYKHNREQNTGGHIAVKRTTMKNQNRSAALGRPAMKLKLIMSIFRNNDNTLVDEHFCVIYLARRRNKVFRKKMTSLSIKIVFLSGSPLRNEIT